MAKAKIGKAMTNRNDDDDAPLDLKRKYPPNSGHNNQTMFCILEISNMQWN